MGHRAGALGIGWLGVTFLGCATAPAPAPAAPPEPERAVLGLTNDESADQRAAQAAWCGYLEALYLRASTGATRWPRYRQCTEVVTYAAPKMLERTAACSMRALSRFEGDPFTDAYAAEVNQCGVEALDASVVTPTDVAPFVATICDRVSVCGVVDAGECRADLADDLPPNFQRAVGAINRRGRAELRACLKSASCSEVGAQISTCLEPIMDGLLWIPG